MGSVERATSFGKVVHNANNTLIESDFQEVVVRENSAGSIFCFGSVKSKDKSKEIEASLDLISEQSLHSVVSELEERFVLFLVTQNGLYAMFIIISKKFAEYYNIKLQCVHNS